LYPSLDRDTIIQILTRLDPRTAALVLLSEKLQRVLPPTQQNPLVGVWEGTVSPETYTTGVPTWARDLLGR